MGNRVKEEERIEKIIRGLLKQPENRRCINCNSLGPQYVCTTFWTFVCTNCSGVHREFTHRVKSVSMAKFNAEEVSALQAGGNERARQIYFKTWDPQRSSYPDSSNLHRLREFIRHVYVDRKYAGGNGNDKLSMVKLSHRNESYERRSFEKLSFGSREDALARCPFDRDCKSGIDEEKYTRFDGKSLKNIMEERSPRYIQENVRSGSHRSRATRFEIVDDRFRDDGIVKQYDRYAGKESRAEISSPYSQKSRDARLPEIRPVREILGGKFQSLGVSEPVNANDGKETDANYQNSTKGNQKQNNTQSLCSLIDFDANPAPNDTTTSAATSTAETTENSKTANSVESLLFEFSAPLPSNTVVTSQMPETPSAATPAPSNTSMPTDVISRNLPEISVSVGTLSVPNKDTNQTFHNNSCKFTAQVTEAHQRQNSSPASNEVKPVSSVPFQQSSQSAESGDGTMLNRRKELPVDLFASNFTGVTPAVPGWHHHGMNYGMQFQPPAMSMAAFPNPTRPSNPFDIGDDRPQAQAPMLPSMSLGPVSMPHMPPPPGTFLQPQPSSPYATPFSSHATPYGINMPFNRSPVMNAGFGASNDGFTSQRPIHQSDSINADTPPSSRGVNPFG